LLNAADRISSGRIASERHRGETMPELTIEQIKEKIVSGEIQAISVDTNIFDKYQCNLRHPLLTSLGQFRDTNVDVLLSEIVTGEIRAHLTADAAETQRASSRSFYAT